jgi:hypothetical protein
MSMLEREILQTAAIAAAAAGSILMLSGAGAWMFGYIQDRRSRVR